MNLRIFLQISEYKCLREKYCKETFPYHPNFRCISSKYDEVVYIIVFIKIHVGKDMDHVHYGCDVFYYSTGTWQNCDDDRIPNYSGYP